MMNLYEEAITVAATVDVATAAELAELRSELQAMQQLKAGLRPANAPSLELDNIYAQYVKKTLLLVGFILYIVANNLLGPHSQ